MGACALLSTGFGVAYEWADITEEERRVGGLAALERRLRTTKSAIKFH